MGVTNNNTSSIFHKNIGGNQVKICQKCNIDFEHGDLVYNKRGGSKRKKYHQKCWEKMQL